MLTALSWLAFVALAGLFGLLAVQQHRWASREQLARSLGIASALTGSLMGWAMVSGGVIPGMVGVLAGIAIGTVGMLLAIRRIWQDVGEDGDRTVAASLGAAAIASAAACRDVLKRLRNAPERGTPAAVAGAVMSDELAPRRDRRSAPAPDLPPADGPAPTGPRVATRSDIPPDHAAAHQRIASFEPEGLGAHVHFLVSEAKALAGYGDAFGTYADGLIHGPGVPPEALKATFDLADMFEDVRQVCNLANKKVLDYFQGHLEWAESHEPTKDGRWTVRD